MEISRDRGKFFLRMPPGMRDRVRIRAAISRRSMNAEFLVLIERGLASDKNRTMSPLDQPTEGAAKMLQNID